MIRNSLGNDQSNNHHVDTPKVSQPQQEGQPDPTSSSFSPPPPPPRRSVTVDVVLSAADQFVAFACGSAVARTGERSPARLLAVSPSLVEQFGREWVACGCRDVVFSLYQHGGLSPKDPYDTVHVWLCVSPTLGVVRSVWFATLGPSCELAGCIGLPPATARRAHREGGVGVSDLGCSGRVEGGETGDDMLLMWSHERGMTFLDIVDWKGSVVRNLLPGDGTRVSSTLRSWVKCNRRWLVVMDPVYLTIWRLWGGDPCEGGANLLPGECSEKIKLDRFPVGCALQVQDPDVMLLSVGKSNYDFSGFSLLHVDLMESFNQRAIVFKKPPVPLLHDLNHYHTVLGGDPICTVSAGPGSVFEIHNTTTNQTHKLKGSFHPLGSNLFALCTFTNEVVYKVFHTSELHKPCIVLPYRRGIPGVTDGEVLFRGTSSGGGFVWGNEARPGRQKYAITDAVTDTLLAFVCLCYNRKKST